MPITDFLINKSGLQEQRDNAIDYAQERYDPSVYSPQLDYARERATEGISEGQESIARQRTVESLFRPTDTSIYGGNQARAIAGQQQRNRQAQQGMAQFESNLTQQDLQAQDQGARQFAQTRTQQKQTAAKQDAAIEEAEMQYEAELQNRRKQLGQTVANLAGTVAGSFLGPAGAAAGGALAGGLVGGGSGAVTGAGAGFTTSFQRQQSQDFIDQLTGGGESQQQTGLSGEELAEYARQSVEAPQGARSLGMDFSALEGGDANFGSQMQLPQQSQQQQLPQLNLDMGDESESVSSQGFNMIEDARTRNFINELMNFQGQVDEQSEQQLPTTSFSATGQFLGQGNLKGPSIMELLEGYFDFQGANTNATGQYLR